MDDENLKLLTTGDVIQFQLQDIIASMNNLNLRNHSTHRLKELLVSKWGLSAFNSSYTRYIIFADGSISTSPHKGRYYELSEERFLEINH